jgi:hypothetical protein
MFEIGPQTLLRECEYLLREFGGRRRSGARSARRIKEQTEGLFRLIDRVLGELT